jgi:hypothetical protein
MNRRKKNQKLVRAAYASRDAKLPNGEAVAKAKHGPVAPLPASEKMLESLLPIVYSGA